MTGLLPVHRLGTAGTGGPASHPVRLAFDHHRTSRASATARHLTITSRHLAASHAVHAAFTGSDGSDLGAVDGNDVGLSHFHSVHGEDCVLGGLLDGEGKEFLAVCRSYCNGLAPGCVNRCTHPALS